MPPSLPKNLKPVNLQPTVAPSSFEQGLTNKGRGSKNVYSSTTKEKSPRKPYPAGASYARFDPSKNKYTTVHYFSPSTTGTSNPPVVSHNGSTNHGIKQPNSLPTTMASSTASSRPPDQWPAVALTFSRVRLTNQRTISNNAQAASAPYSNLANRHPALLLPIASFPPNQGPNLTRFTLAATIQNTSNGIDINSSIPSIERAPKDFPQLTLMSKSLRRRIEDLVKMDGEITDKLKSLGSAWIPEKLQVVEIGSKGHEREKTHDNEKSAELAVLRTKFATVQKLREEEAKIQAEEWRREDVGKAELQLLKKKLEAVIRMTSAHPPKTRL